jgi:hypothetical protein
MAYHDAILRLHDDPALYEQKRAASVALQAQFYDPQRGWARALLRALGRHPEATNATDPSYNQVKEPAEPAGRMG